MSEAKKILEMIEAVDPSDTDTLDEIDARVWCLLRNINPDASSKKLGNIGEKITHVDCKAWEFQRVRYAAWDDHPSDDEMPEYTRSRDALKSIRPEGWQYNMAHDGGEDAWKCALTKWGARCTPLCWINSQWNISKLIKTEELAELHAIIQAIEWEIQNDKH